MTIVCGTGGVVGPLSGDPNNNLILSAVAAFLGIKVSWTYPTLNPEAVAHILLYRGTSSNFNTAINIVVVAGSEYLDILTEASTYYYWIKVVSIHGTIGDLIGPASATSTAIGNDIIEYIPHDSIGSTLLDPLLRSPIELIPTNTADILQEISDRLGYESAINTFLTQVQDNADIVSTMLLDEVTRSVTADSALVTAINGIAATANGNTAAIANELIVRANADSAMSALITALTSTVNTNTAAIITEASTRATADTAEALARTTLATTVSANTSAIASEAITRANADSTEATARTTLQSQTATNLASAQSTLQTNINTVDGKVSAMYVMKLEANGLIGGFGLYNTGATVEAKFDVSKFSIGGTGLGNVAPFVVDGGVVYIENARIKNLSIGSSKITNNNISNSVYVEAFYARGIATGSLYWYGRVHITATFFNPNSASYIYTLYRDSTIIWQETSGGLSSSIITITFVDTPAVGYHTYTANVDVGGQVYRTCMQLLDIQK